MSQQQRGQQSESQSLVSTFFRRLACCLACSAHGRSLTERALSCRSAKTGWKKTRFEAAADEAEAATAKLAGMPTAGAAAGGAAASSEAKQGSSQEDGGGGTKAGGLHARRKPQLERKGTVGKGGGARGGPSVKWEAVTARLDGLSTGGQLEALSEDGGTWGFADWVRDGCGCTSYLTPLAIPPNPPIPSPTPPPIPSQVRELNLHRILALPFERMLEPAEAPAELKTVDGKRAFLQHLGKQGDKETVVAMLRAAPILNELADALWSGLRRFAEDMDMIGVALDEREAEDEQDEEVRGVGFDPFLCCCSLRYCSPSLLLLAVLLTATRFHVPVRRRRGWSRRRLSCARSRGNGGGWSARRRRPTQQPSFRRVRGDGTRGE